MPNRRFRALAFALALPLAFAGCDKFKARTAFKQANVSYKNENYREAIAGYERGLALDPSAKKVWRSLGLAAMAVYRPGDTSKQNLEYAATALEAFENYAAAFPQDPKVQEYILTVLMGSERYDEALKRLRELAAKNPTDKPTLQAIATILTKQRKLEEADNKLLMLGETIWQRSLRCRFPRSTFLIGAFPDAEIMTQDSEVYSGRMAGTLEMEIYF